MENKKRVKVRFPNECFFDDMEIDMNEFKPEKEFDDQVFGWYKGVYISIEKESHE